MANEAEQAIYQRLASAPLFHPASVELLPEDWGIETGDVVSVKSGTETYNVPVYSHTLVWNGKSKATIESTGNQEREPLPELRRKEYQQGHATYTGFKAQQQEIDEHYQHVIQVTDKGMSDAFGIIGVKIGADGMPEKDSSGNYIWDDSGSGGEIWGHLNRTAWSTQIVNHIKDANGKIISLGEVYTDAYGNAIINAINDQRTGTAKVRADRIKIDSTSGSSFSIGSDGTMTFNAENAIAAINAAEATINADRIKLDAKDTITLNALLGIQANTGYLRVNGTLSVKNNIYATDNISLGDTLIIGESTGTQGDETGRLFFRGTEYFEKPIRMGVTSPFIVSGRVLADSVKDVIDLNHSHAVSMTEQTTGANAGKVHAVIGEPVSYSSSSTANRESFFDIAASQTYLNGVAAARDSIQAVLNGTSSKPTSGTSAGSATEGWYYQALTSYSGTESYTRKYGGYVYVPKYTVTKGSWNNGDITFTRETTTGTPSTSQSISLSLSAVQMVSTDPNKWTVTAYDGNRNTGESVEVDATSRYEAGRIAGASDGAASVTLSQTAPSGGKVRVSASNGEYEDVDWRTANLISKITLGSGDTGSNVGKYVNVRYDNGDSTTSVPVTVDASAVYAAGQGGANVDVRMGSWSSGVVTFSPSSGSGKSKTLKLSNVSGPNSITGNGTYTYEVMYEDDYGDDVSTGLTKEVTVNVPTGGGGSSITITTLGRSNGQSGSVRIFEDGEGSSDLASLISGYYHFVVKAGGQQKTYCIYIP